MALLREGDEEAAARLWSRYVRRLEGLLRTRVHGAAYDEQDVALSAFHVFCQGVAEGRYPELSDRDQLWRILATIAVRKARDRFEAETCRKRGGLPADQADDVDMNSLASRDEGPEFAAVMADECRRLLELLQSPRLEQVVLWKLDGHTNEEIAAMLGLTRWSVGRMLNCARKIWATQMQSS
jgi:DNA-directed RNA polymerase specialized sigma24 family protein